MTSGYAQSPGLILHGMHRGKSYWLGVAGEVQRTSNRSRLWQLTGHERCCILKSPFFQNGGLDGSQTQSNGSGLRVQYDAMLIAAKLKVEESGKAGARRDRNVDLIESDPSRSKPAEEDGYRLASDRHRWFCDRNL